MNAGGRIEQRRDESRMEIPPRRETRGGPDEPRVAQRDIAPEVQHAFVEDQGSQKWKYTAVGTGSFKIQELELWLLCQRVDDWRFSRRNDDPRVELPPAATTV